MSLRMKMLEESSSFPQLMLYVEGCVMLWACFPSKGLVNFVRIYGTIDLLEVHVKYKSGRLYLKKESTLVLSTGKLYKHMAKSLHKKFTHKANLVPLQCQSSWLNPTENWWAKLKKRQNKRIIRRDCARENG
ncbi:hypothetical protein AMECASPLE_009862 [Ameca splendens]|uniref:Uncharacterized protein n=1 Tax=Ameca splendens TaxID=208324 RepID=A0ABV0Z958_9TELE